MTITVTVRDVPADKLAHDVPAIRLLVEAMVGVGYTPDSRCERSATTATLTFRKFEKP